MRRFVVASALAGSLALASVGSALGAIHPIVSAECAAALASLVANDQNPVGQFKGGAATEAAFFNGEVAATGSFLRAVIATGVILVDENGFFAGVDFTRAALNGNSGVENNCPNA
jgi:hypothetical protein